MNGISPNIKKGSPKTPGGISKSLLTPCRRVGLSRNWKKGGCSPFISPLGAQSVTPERTIVKEPKKRKKCDENEHNEGNSEETADQFDSCHNISPMSNKLNSNNDINLTPCRITETPRIKSKILSLSLKNNQEDGKEKVAEDISYTVEDSENNERNVMGDKSLITSSEKLDNTEVIQETIPISPALELCVSTPIRTVSKNKKLSLKKSLSKSELKKSKSKDSSENLTPKDNSPNKLSKECIVVIQKEILKTGPQITNDNTEKGIQNSDSEPDVPLSALTRKNVENVTLNTLDEDDFISKPVKKKLRKLSMIKKTTSNSKDSSSASQSSQEDIRTIIVKKTYDKVTMPQKAKSTGSITQKDIDDLKARIEMKKKLLLAKSMSIDTEELRGLIKKWQKGCQDALMELLDLMKKKLPDRQNMDYAEILKTLKIPAELVGYDPENDCFITPNDTNILLSAFKL